jgi:hypothetical protein
MNPIEGGDSQTKGEDTRADDTIGDTDVDDNRDFIQV